MDFLPHGIRKIHPRSNYAQLLTLIGLAVLLGAAGCKRAHGPDVMATVNGKPIMRAEVSTAYENSLGDSQQKAPSQVQANIVRLNIVRQLIDEEILMQRAAKLNVVATDDEVNTKLNEIKAPFTPDEFNKQLAAKHLTLDDLKREIRRGLTETKLFNKEINSKIDVTDADITGYFNAHKSEYNLIEPEYHLAQIVVTSAPAPGQQAGNLQNSKAANDAQAKKKIETLHNRLESGEDFGLLATNFSERPDTAPNGGDIGFVKETDLHADPDVYNAVMKLKPGQITDVLPVYADAARTKVTGYAIYKLLEKEPAGQRDLSDPRVQQQIRGQLRDSRSQLLKNAYIEMLRDQARVQNYFAEEIFKNGEK